MRNVNSAFSEKNQDRRHAVPMAIGIVSASVFKTLKQVQGDAMLCFVFVIMMLFGFGSCQQNGKLENGVIAPDLTMPDVNGKKIDLKSLRGNIVLVDFWASWCKPCRRSNPYLVQVYDEFSGKQFQGAKGFTILSVSLDTDKDAWLKAMQADNLHWPLQVSELNGWHSSAVAAYGIDAIPMNFLVDQDGMIIGKDMRSDDLEKLLGQRVKK